MYIFVQDRDNWDTGLRHGLECFAKANEDPSYNLSAQVPHQCLRSDCC